MASLLDLLRKKDPNMSLDDARKALSLNDGQNFDALGSYVPSEEMPSKPDLMGPIQKEVPAIPQIYNDDYDPSANVDVERNPVESSTNTTPVATKPAAQAKPARDFAAEEKAAMAKLGQDDTQGPAQETMGDEIKPESQKSDADKKLEDQYAKEDADAHAGVDDNKEQVPTAQAQKVSSLNDRFRAAQEAKANAEDTAMWSKIGAQLGGGIGKQSQNVVQNNMNLADMVAKRGSRPMEQLQQEIAFQKEDPGSQYSQAARDFLKNKFNVELPEGLSAEQLSNTFFAPALKSFEADQNRQMTMNKLQSEHEFKDMELKQKLEQGKEKLEEAIRNHKDTADIRRSQQELMKMLAQNKLDAQQEAKDDKQDKDAHARIDKLGKTLNAEVASSRSAFGRNANNIRAAKAALTLADQYKGHEDDMDSRQVAEFAKSLDALLSGGQPTVSGLKKLLPDTGIGRAKSFQEFITNMPKGVKQGEFVRRARETVERERDLAASQIKDTQGALLKPYRDLAEHEKYGQYMQDVLPEGLTVDDIFNKAKNTNKAPVNNSEKSETVTVMSPEGKTGTIPKANLQKAINKGFKVIE